LIEKYGFEGAKEHLKLSEVDKMKISDKLFEKCGIDLKELDRVFAEMGLANDEEFREMLYAYI
jgi:hypothetical protein